jgi:hypothetical protein
MASGELRRAAARACALSALAGFALAIATFYPGQLTVDGAMQLTEARSGVYYDWHPPLLARIWSVLDAIAPGTVGLFLLNNLCFWTGLALAIYLSALRPLAAAVAVLAVGLFPPVFSALGVTWKDVSLGAALLLAFALLWWAQARSSRPALAFGVAVLFCACAIRHNAGAAVLPLALWVPVIWCEITGHAPAAGWQRLIVGLVLFALLAVGAVALNRGLVTGGRLFPAQQLYLHDLAAISVATGEVRMPGSLRMDGPRTLEAMTCLYTAESCAPLFSAAGGACPTRIEKITDPDRMADLEAEWRQAVLSEPRAYLGHRWAVFREQFAITRDRVCYPLHVRNDGTTLIAFDGTLLYDPALRLFSVAAYWTPLFRGWAYLALAAALLVGAGRRGSVPLVVLASSGLVYGLAYFAIGSACPFRLHWWSVVSALTTLVLAVSHRRRPG